MGWFFHFCLRIFQKCLPLIFDDSFIFVAEKTTIPNNLHELNCCERWSILLPWICWHCLTQQVVLEPIGFNLSFCIDKGFLGSGFWWHFWPSYELVLSSFLPSNILDFWIFLPIWFLHQWLLKRVLAFFCIQPGLIWSLCSQKICYFYSLLGYCTQSIKHCYWLAPVGPVSTSALWVYLDVFLLKMLLIILGFITDFWQFSVSLTTFPLFLTISLWFHEFLVFYHWFLTIFGKS